jgi:NitT/TauT family transport system ATP-binding protein
VAAGIPAANPPGAGPLCEARNVSHEFQQPGGHALRVLEDITLAIEPNEVVALLGPSGCGKSTLLRILAGLTPPTSGEVRGHGIPLAGLNPGVAMVFQSFALFPWMTAEANVRTALQARGVEGGELRARVSAVVSSVGLAGFEHSYPRELSGGMKQRVGMARALSVNPELLLMDEPFSAVDALTAETLRAEVIDLWSSTDNNPSSILLVSHDIKEVAYMADRIVVMAAHPGRVQTVVRNPLPRPRDYRDPELLRLVDELHDIIIGGALPDRPAAVPAVAAGIEPLPSATPVEITGLLEYLDARGGHNDLFHIASDTLREFGHVIAIVHAAEMLTLVETPQRMVSLTPAGRRFLKLDAPARRALWREHILGLKLFRAVMDALNGASGREVDRDFVLELLALHLPAEDPQRVFRTLVQWAHAGELFSYQRSSRRLTLP